ncbi:hypothetical protein [Methylacidimicrobium tartarophylax]|uniref:DNA recombination and repair protein Rad51-like C-terminal domain-containing protein n=1 Tax=Methylacidimicrobium tartarophylax TaxID=1041768 RepID=A0A5E6MC22_9BACT|nr:hypothetical protein [Methylacidimicrobium tartarophylax]VVM06460.1 hypothetical protein MAMT_01201 [Methylacidimicrobium tartarophylax]
MLPPQLVQLSSRLGLLDIPRGPRGKRLSFLEESPDPWLRRGVLSHALTELAAPGPGAGLLLSAALCFCARTSLPAALVDGADSFDPKSGLAGPTPSLLWVRCRLLREILRAADLLLRDGSFPLVWIDLSRLSPSELRRIPSTTWHRFGRLVERKGTAALLITPLPWIPEARERYRIESSLSLDRLEEPREALWQRLRLAPLRLSGSGSPGSPARLAAAAG